MKRMKSLLSVLLCAALLSGCYHDVIVMDANYDPSKRVPDADRMQVHLINGLINVSGEVDLDATCGQRGAGLAETKTNFNLGFFGWGLISFGSMKVYCKK